MASLDNNVNRANVWRRWEDWVAALAKISVTWGTNAKPFAEAPDAWFGGSTASLPATAAYSSEANLGDANGIITAATVRTGLIAATTDWTHMRNMRARRYYNYQGTAQSQQNLGPTKAYQPLANRQAISTPVIPTAGPSSGNLITEGASAAVNGTGMEEYFENCRNAYIAKRDVEFENSITVCHYSCHSSCHGSRGRR